MTGADLYTILPMLVVVVWAVLLMLADLWIPKDRKGITAILAAAGLAVALGFTLAQGGKTAAAMNGMVVVDGFSVLMDIGSVAAIDFGFRGHIF